MICPRAGGRGHFWELLGWEPARRARPWHEQSSHLASEPEQHCSFPVWKDGKKAQTSPKHPSGHCFGGTAISSCAKFCKAWADSLSAVAAPHFLMAVRVQYPCPQVMTPSNPFGGRSKVSPQLLSAPSSLCLAVTKGTSHTGTGEMEVAGSCSQLN